MLNHYLLFDLINSYLQPMALLNECLHFIFGLQIPEHLQLWLSFQSYLNLSLAKADLLHQQPQHFRVALFITFTKDVSHLESEAPQLNRSCFFLVQLKVKDQNFNFNYSFEDGANGSDYKAHQSERSQICYLDGAGDDHGD